MFPTDPARRALFFVNVGHALDHFLLLVYPTAVLAIARETGLNYGELIGLSTGAFVAFGLFSLPVGWLADRIGRRTMLAIYFFGYGLSSIALAFAQSPLAFAAGLLVLGIFSAIYHPVGIAMLVARSKTLGRDLGLNGVFGNFGAATAAGVTAFLATWLGWRAAFVAPGLVCLACGIAFVKTVPAGPEPATPEKKGAARNGSGGLILLGLLFLVVIMGGGLAFNVMTIALPKVIDERLGTALPLALTGSLATLVFAFAAAAQYSMGRLVDRLPLHVLFVATASLLPLGLFLAASSTGLALLAGLVLGLASVYMQVVVNDAILANYVPAKWRSLAYGLRYFLGFTVAGFAAPLIAATHESGGFPLTLSATGAAGLLVLLATIGFAATIMAWNRAAPAPAE